MNFQDFVSKSNYKISFLSQVRQNNRTRSLQECHTCVSRSKGQLPFSLDDIRAYVHGSFVVGT